MHGFRTILSGFALSALTLSISSVSQAAQPVADLIYSGGKIVTVDDLKPEAEAVAVKGGITCSRIQAQGDACSSAITIAIYRGGLSR